MNRSDYQVDVLVNGKPVKQYYRNGRNHIEAKVGTEYSIRVKNNSYGKKLAVITVDGVNVVSGEPHVSGVGRGYIIQAKESLTVNGFRKDLEEVGAFKFCQKGASYCNEKGLKGNNGVIGVRIYDERASDIVFGEILKRSNKDYPVLKPIDYPTFPHPTYWDSTITCNTDGFQCNLLRSATPKSIESPKITSCSMQNSTPEFDVGTSWGSKIKDSAIESYFDVNDNSFQDFEIYYDSRKNLEKIGINFQKETQVSKEYPKAFGAFARPPENWRG